MSDRCPKCYLTFYAQSSSSQAEASFNKTVKVAWVWPFVMLQACDCLSRALLISQKLPALNQLILAALLIQVIPRELPRSNFQRTHRVPSVAAYVISQCMLWTLGIRCSKPVYSIHLETKILVGHWGQTCSLFSWEGCQIKWMGLRWGDWISNYLNSSQVS